MYKSRQFIFHLFQEDFDDDDINNLIRFSSQKLKSLKLKDGNYLTQERQLFIFTKSGKPVFCK